MRDNSSNVRIPIVIADDNRVMADVVRFNLDKAGFEVHVARDGAEAWQLVDLIQPAVLVTDYQMPRMNGAELCRKVRADARFSSMPIILVTAKGMESEYVRSQSELGIHKLMCKPFSPRELVNTVRECLVPQQPVCAE